MLVKQFFSTGYHPVDNVYAKYTKFFFFTLLNKIWTQGLFLLLHNNDNDNNNYSQLLILTAYLQISRGYIRVA